MPTLNPADMKSVAQFVLAFLDPHFSFKDAHAYFGPATEEDEDLIEIVPDAGSPFEQVDLEKLESANGPPMLSGISVYFKQPFLFDFDKLAAQFGPEEESPRLKRPPPIPYSFDLKSEAFEGYLLLIVPELARRNRVRKVEHLIVRRFPRSSDGDAALSSAGITVLAALGAIEKDRAFPEVALSAPEDLGRVLELLRPQFMGEIASVLGGKAAQLSIQFAPTQIDDFTPDRILRLCTPLGKLVAARALLVKFGLQQLSLEKLQAARLDNGMVPAFDAALKPILAGAETDPTRAIQALDRVLSAQAEILFADAAFKAFQSNWLGLQYLAESIQADAGLRLDIASVGPEASTRAFKERWFEQEKLRPVVAPLAIIPEMHEESLDAQGSAGELLALARQTRTVVVSSLHSASQIRDSSLGRGLILGLPRICLRPGIDVPGFGPTCFAYAPTGKKGDTTVWGSAAWAVAALLAASQVKLGRLAPESVTITLPPLVRSAPESVPAILEAMSPPSASFTILKYSKEEQTISLAKLCAVSEGSKPLERLPALLCFNPLMQTIRRLRYLHAADTDPGRIVEPLKKALQGRLPDALAEVEAKAGRLKVEVIPTFPIEGKLSSFKYDEPWPEAR